MEKLPLIVLHGALGSASQMQPLTQILSIDAKVHVFDLSGHGADSRHQTFSIELFTDDLFRYMASNDIGRAHVFGYSMGGYIALHAAAEHPQRFGRLITLGTQFHWTVDLAFKEIGMLRPEVIESKVPAFARLLDSRHHGTDWRSNMWKTALLMLHLGHRQLLNAEKLKAIPNRVLIMRGDADRMVSAETSQEAANYLQRGEYLELANTPHPFEQVDYAMLANTIIERLKQTAE